MFGMLAVLAELQRELILANTRDGLSVRARSRTRGRPPAKSHRRAGRPRTRALRRRRPHRPADRRPPRRASRHRLRAPRRRKQGQAPGHSPQTEYPRRRISRLRVPGVGGQRKWRLVTRFLPARQRGRAHLQQPLPARPRARLRHTPTPGRRRARHHRPRRKARATVVRNIVRTPLRRPRRGRHRRRSAKARPSAALSHQATSSPRAHRCATSWRLPIGHHAGKPGGRDQRNRPHRDARLFVARSCKRPRVAANRRGSHVPLRRPRDHPAPPTARCRSWC